MSTFKSKNKCDVLKNKCYNETIAGLFKRTPNKNIIKWTGVQYAHDTPVPIVFSQKYIIE